MKKKILHIIAQYPDRTGSGTYLKAIIKELSNWGYSQSVIYAINSGDEADIESHRMEKEYIVEFDTDSLPFKVPGMSDSMPYESIRYCDMTEDMLEKWNSAFKETIEKAIEEYDPDIIMTHHLWLLTALTVEISGNRPVLTFCHGTDIRQIKKGCRYEDYIVKNCKKADLIFSLSEDQKLEINGIYGIDPDKIEVIGGGFDSEKFYLPIKRAERDKIKLIYVGKLSYSKGVKSLISAYEKLKEDTELILVGSGEGLEGKDILNRVKKSKKDIKLKGQVSQTELGAIFREGDIFVLPSFYEGLSLVTIEALASGLRVVVSEIEGLKKHLGDTINNSGLIEYVKLPRMKNVDEPLEHELEDFENRLIKSIERQIEEKRSEADFEKAKEVYGDIISKSWTDIVMKVDRKIKKMSFKE